MTTTRVSLLAGARQYVVVSAGGGDLFGIGDYLVAFSLLRADWFSRSTQFI